MIRDPKYSNQVQRLPYRQGLSGPVVGRRPFWLPASNYYFLASAIGVAFFFLVWGVLHEGEDSAAWVPAGVGAGLLVLAAVILREIVLRKARNRYLLAQRRLDYNLSNIRIRPANGQGKQKLSLQRNSEILAQIRKKSDAAKVLMKLGDGHHEVFELCTEYLELNKRELESAGFGSPRVSALRQSRELVGELHKFHLLAWVEIESKALTQAARNCVTISEKVDTAQNALHVLSSALQYYPNERALLDSEAAVREFMVSIKVSHWIEQAESEAFQANYGRAVSHYEEALYFLARENLQNREIELIAQKINSEIEKLREMTHRPKHAGNFEDDQER